MVAAAKNSATRLATGFYSGVTATYERERGGVARGAVTGTLDASARGMARWTSNL